MKLGWLLDRFASAPGQVAFVHRDRAVTYGALAEQVAAFVALLRERGVRAGERVVVLGDYTP